VLAAGVSQTAATVHWVDEGIDTGPVIRTEPVPVEPGDTPDTSAPASSASSTASCPRS